jgi:hypothetical protein
MLLKGLVLIFTKVPYRVKLFTLFVSPFFSCYFGSAEQSVFFLMLCFFSEMIVCYVIYRSEIKEI